jgi:hypothetical protein
MFTGFILGRRRGLLLRVRFITAAFDKASSDDQKRPAIGYEAITFNGKPKASDVRLTDGPVSAFGDR